ncbi:hypothetical protein CW751_10765 [Brumimicrobium salinarum]|uniref:Sec-independent protein translocase protein TatA n=1 Tax=Brumimicrobium salinarum TaxID=2058658 RepID=A0A2I0R199_9FLAO|nr:twin-arginine translocase TatA/TatE family subunit [Brumimicrobium salinarum]PKR80325.1 hypothetical protein CW751_10765 [Brumimicrobium salinarum]
MFLFINSIAGSEIIIILLFVLIFFGAKSIPGMARGLGKGIRQVKDASQDIQDEIRKTSTEMKRDMNVNRTIHEAKNSLEAPVRELKDDLQNSGADIAKNINAQDVDKKQKSVPPTIQPKPNHTGEEHVKPDQQVD